VTSGDRISSAPANLRQATGRLHPSENRPTPPLSFAAISKRSPESGAVAFLDLRDVMTLRIESELPEERGGFFG
jgi:hypothetical protein